MATVLGPDDFIDMPWKNGGGMTRELYRLNGGPGEDFALRLSMARVGQSGPFSFFPGIDRVLMLVEGEGFELGLDDGSRRRLTEPLVPFRFAGEQAVDCRLLGGECLDFNLMTARTWGRAEPVVHALAAGRGYHGEPGPGRLWYLHGPAPRLWVLAPGETLELEAGDRPRVLVEILLYPLAEHGA